MRDILIPAAIIGAIIFGLHSLFVGWFANNTVRACENPRYRDDPAVCSCIKSELRASIIPEKLLLGGGKADIDRVFRQCKGLS